MLPVAPAAADTASVSPFCGLPISVIPKYAVNPVIPSAPRKSVSETNGIDGIFWKGNFDCASMTTYSCKPRAAHHFADSHRRHITVRRHPDAHRRIHRQIFHLRQRLTLLHFRHRRFAQHQISRRQHPLRPRLQSPLSVRRHSSSSVAQPSACAPLSFKLSSVQRASSTKTVYPHPKSLPRHLRLPLPSALLRHCAARPCRRPRFATPPRRLRPLPPPRLRCARPASGNYSPRFQSSSASGLLWPATRATGSALQ